MLTTCHFGNNRIYIIYNSLPKFKTLLIIAEKYRNMYLCLFYVVINEL